MTDKQLSPAAQAVKDAAQDAYWLWDSMCPADAETIAAAALRGLVFQLQYYNCLEGEDMVVDARAILDVADELEGKK
jgi:hypothetical protein